LLEAVHQLDLTRLLRCC